jgi:hypothetical protein
MKFMKSAATLVAFAVFTMAASAQVQIVTDDRPLLTEADSLEPFLWVARPVVVFADTPNDPRFIRQLELLESRKDALFERDVVVIADTDPANPSEIRQQLRPRGFSVVLVAKDGRVNLRKPEPWDVRELTRNIDKMPLRQQEIRDRSRPGAG